MKQAGPFAKAFVIAGGLYAAHLLIGFAIMGFDFGGRGPNEVGELVGAAMAPYILSALIAGAAGKFALKKASWLTLGGICFPLSMLLVASTISSS